MPRSGRNSNVSRTLFHAPNLLHIRDNPRDDLCERDITGYSTPFTIMTRMMPRAITGADFRIDFMNFGNNGALRKFLGIEETSGRADVSP
jgi:hypothetical protein